MPISGEMRLRQLIFALIALASIWVGVVAQRSHHTSHRATAFTAGPTPPDFSAPKRQARLVHVPGLKRPAAASPIVVSERVQPYVHASGGAPKVTPKTVRLKHAKPAEQPSDTTAVVDEGSRLAADTPPPPLEPLAISDVQVTALTSSSAQITWRTNVPTLEQTAFGLDGPAVWAAPSSAVVIDHVSTLTGLEFSTTYTAYLHAVDE